MKSGYVPRPGFIRNPLLRFPRNKKCPCNSGKKFKHCHLNVLPYAIPDPKQMKKPEVKAPDENAGTPPNP